MADSVSVTSNRYQALIVGSVRAPRRSIPRLMLATAAASSPRPAWAAASAAIGGSTAWMSPMRADVSAALGRERRRLLVAAAPGQEVGAEAAHLAAEVCLRGGRIDPEDDGLRLGPAAGDEEELAPAGAEPSVEDAVGNRAAGVLDALLQQRLGLGIARTGRSACPGRSSWRRRGRRHRSGGARWPGRGCGAGSRAPDGRPRHSRHEPRLL